MNRLKRFPADAAASLLRVAARHPVETALSLYACILGSIQIEWAAEWRAGAGESALRELPDGVFTILPLAMLAALITNTLTQRAARPLRCLYYLAAPLTAAAAWPLGTHWFGSSQFFITSAVLAPLALLLVHRTLSNRPFVRQTALYLYALAAGALFALTTMLAAFAIYYSISYIFNLGGSWEARTHVESYIALLSWGLSWPFAALAFLDRHPDEELRSTRTLQTLIDWILTPALLIYTAILYLYGLQILVQWNLPKGGVAYLVFGFTIALFLVKALQEFAAKRRYDWFYGRISYAALPPLVLFWAGVAQRVGDYGLTDWRVYLIVCGAVMTLAVGVFLHRRTARDYYIAATAFALFFLTAYVPRFSATALSLRSQTARAQRLAAETGLADTAGRLDLARIAPRDSAMLKRYRELYASLDYLDDRDTTLLYKRFGIARSARFLDAFPDESQRCYLRLGWNGTEADCVEVVAEQEYFDRSDRRGPIDVGAYRYRYDPTQSEYRGVPARYANAGDTLRLFLPGGREIFRRSFEDLFRERCSQLSASPDDESLYTADNLLVYRTDSLLIVFSTASVSQSKKRYEQINVDTFYTK